MEENNSQNTGQQIIILLQQLIIELNKIINRQNEKELSITPNA